MSEYTVLPLLNSAFKPGTAVEVVERFEDSDFRNIARAELFYFSGRAKECCEIAESYLEDEAIELRLSACILYGYSNLSLGNSAAARRKEPNRCRNARLCTQSGSCSTRCISRHLP